MKRFGTALAVFALTAPGFARAQEPPAAGDEPALELPTAEEAARLFGSVADTSRFLSTPSGALDTFLHRAHDKSGKPVVVVQYGDSHTQAGILPRELRDQLAGGGTTSPGFVAPGLHNLGDASAVTQGHWTKKNWIKPEDQGPFGPLGVAWVTHDPHARVVLRLASPAPQGTMVTALYSRATAHAPIRLNSATGMVAMAGAEALKAKEEHPLLGAITGSFAPGTSEVELVLAPDKKSPGELRFFGFLVREPGAAVEWDALGITGTSVEHPLRGDKTMEEYLALRQPDLIVVWFGSNSLVAPNFDPPTYEKDYAQFLARIAAASPGASRLAIGPPDLERRPQSCDVWYGHSLKHLSPMDHAVLPNYLCAPETTIMHRPGRPDLFPVRSVKNSGEWLDYIRNCSPRTLAAVTTATEAEKSAALAQGYAFFDTFRFMDGPGSIHRWACQNPRLAAYDLVHLTVDGYTTLAQGLWGALPPSVRSAGGSGSESAPVKHALR